MKGVSYAQFLTTLCLAGGFVKRRWPQGKANAFKSISDSVRNRLEIHPSCSCSVRKYRIVSDNSFEKDVFQAGCPLLVSIQVQGGTARPLAKFLSESLGSPGSQNRSYQAPCSPFPNWRGRQKPASLTPQPFFPKSSNIGQRFIPSWLIISVELKNLLDSSVFKINPLCLFRCYSR
jgi:hypothetical protein